MRISGPEQSTLMRSSKKTRWGVVTMAVLAGIVATMQIGKVPTAIVGIRIESSIGSRRLRDSEGGLHCDPRATRPRPRKSPAGGIGGEWIRSEAARTYTPLG